MVNPKDIFDLEMITEDEVKLGVCRAKTRKKAFGVLRKTRAGWMGPLADIYVYSTY